jgi:hypothetical protein
MWVWVVAVLTTVGLSSRSAFADEIYRSVDATGGVHYSNGPSRATDDAASDQDGERNAGAAADTGTPAEPADTGTRADAADTTFSTEASLRRNALERDLRTSEKQLRTLDQRLDVLGRARMKNAGGSAATSGVGTLAGDVRSEEEKTLAAQRQQLAQHVAEVRDAATKLRQEVTARLGATPEWWVEIR